MEALHQVRAVALTDYARVAASVGLDPLKMLAAAGLTPDALAEPETRIAATTVVKLLEDSADQSGCDDFGLRMAERRTYESLGPTAPVFERLSSLREVVATAVKLKRQLNDIFELEIVDAADRSFVLVSILPQFAQIQVTDLMTAMAHVLFQGASRGGWTPIVVLLDHDAPKKTDRFERFFGAPVKFGQTKNGFECEREALDRPWAGNPLAAAAELVSILEAQISHLSGRLGTGEAINELKTLLLEIATHLRNITDGRD